MTEKKVLKTTPPGTVTFRIPGSKTIVTRTPLQRKIGSPYKCPETGFEGP